MVMFEPAETREWFETVQPGPLAVTLPEPDEDYCYAAARLLSFYPIINSRGATYEKADFDDGILGTLVGKQANLRHDKINKVVGSIIDYALTDDGIDIAIRIDREQADAHGLDLEEMRHGNYFSQVSVELSKDPDHSEFYAIDDGFNVVKRIPVRTGWSVGIRRTTASDPFQFQGKRVAERIKVARFTGVAFVPNPADKTAQLYAVHADDTSEERPIMDPKEPYGDVQYADPGFRGGKKRYPLDTPEHVRAAASYFGMPHNRDKYTPEQRKHIDDSITTAKSKHGIGDEHAAGEIIPQETASMSPVDLQAIFDCLESLQGHVAVLKREKETASAEAQRVPSLHEEIGRLSTELGAVKTELASAATERDTLLQEKATAEREARIDGVLGELEAIMPCADDTERASLREKAASACDDNGVIHTLKLERTVAAQAAKITALEAAKPADPAPEADPAKPENKTGAPGSKENADDGTFHAGVRPAVPLGPVYTAPGSSKSYSDKDLDAAF